MSRLNLNWSGRRRDSNTAGLVPDRAKCDHLPVGPNPPEDSADMDKKAKTPKKPKQPKKDKAK